MPCTHNGDEKVLLSHGLFEACKQERSPQQYGNICKIMCVTEPRLKSNQGQSRLPPIFQTEPKTDCLPPSRVITLTVVR